MKSLIYMHWYRDSDEIFDFPTHPSKWNILNCKVISTSVWCSQIEIVWSTTPPYGQNEQFLEPSVWLILQYCTVGLHRGVMAVRQNNKAHRPMIDHFRCCLRNNLASSHHCLHYIINCPRRSPYFEAFQNLM